jgi:hypothetical protein
MSKSASVTELLCRQPAFKKAALTSSISFDGANSHVSGDHNYNDNWTAPAPCQRGLLRRLPAAGVTRPPMLHFLIFDYSDVKCKKGRNVRY